MGIVAIGLGILFRRNRERFLEMHSLMLFERGLIQECLRSIIRPSFFNTSPGSRRYLLESNDFFAVRDFIDLSKETFAGTLYTKLIY